MIGVSLELKPEPLYILRHFGVLVHLNGQWLCNFLGQGALSPLICSEEYFKDFASRALGSALDPFSLRYVGNADARAYKYVGRQLCRLVEKLGWVPGISYVVVLAYDTRKCPLLV